MKFGEAVMLEQLDRCKAKMREGAVGPADIRDFIVVRWARSHDEEANAVQLIAACRTPASSGMKSLAVEKAKLPGKDKGGSPPGSSHQLEAATTMST